MSEHANAAAKGLNHLIIIANDGKEGYHLAAEYASDPLLKAVFLKYAAERAQFAAELQHLVTATGTDPESGSGPLAALHRVWMDIKAALIADDNKVTLNECITGDKAAVEAYKTVLNDYILTEEQTNTLNRHLKLINDSLFLLQQDAGRTAN